jgi:hypothetical protein
MRLCKPSGGFYGTTESSLSIGDGIGRCLDRCGEACCIAKRGHGQGNESLPGVVVRSYGETPAIIPGFKTVSMRDIVMQPGAKTAGPPMPNAMVCHITEGELRIEQDGKTFTAKKNFVWTCNKDTKETAFNDGNVVGVMRITDLMA